MQELLVLLANPLYVTIGVILVSSMVGFYINSRVRDRCLHDFHGFQVTAVDKTGRVIWGTLHVHTSGLEILYPSAHQAKDSSIQNSYIVYKGEYGNLRAIYRIHDDQSEKNQRRRKRDIKHTYRPSVFRRARRSARNLFSTFRDAIVQAANAVLGYRASLAPQNALLGKYKELTASGGQLLGGLLGNAYEPILERYIGLYVVAEILTGDTTEKEDGVLKEYSAEYLELLNVRVEVPLRVYLKDRYTDEALTRVEQREGTLHVINHLKRPLLVAGIKCGDQTRALDICMDNEEQVEVALTEVERSAPIKAQLRVRCLADMIVPRSRCVVRHGGKHESLSLDELLGLDDLSFPWSKLFDGDEEEQAVNLGEGAATTTENR